MTNSSSCDDWPVLGTVGDDIDSSNHGALSVENIFQ